MKTKNVNIQLFQTSSSKKTGIRSQLRILLLASVLVLPSASWRIGVGLLFISLSACENDIAVVNTVTSVNEKAKPIETSKNVEFLYSDSARVRSKLKSPLVEHFMSKKPYYEMAKGMEVVFYDKNHKEHSKLTANYGIGYDNDNKMNVMEAKGNVIVINEKGDKLNTEHLTWNSLTKKIYTKEFVKITTKDEVIWGNGLEANEDFSEYEIKQVKGTIAVKDNPSQPTQKGESKH